MIAAVTLAVFCVALIVAVLALLRKRTTSPRRAYPRQTVASIQAERATR